MRRERVFGIVFMVLFCFFSIQNFGKDKGPLFLELEEILSIGSLKDDLLFQWVGVVSDFQGFIYITDTMDYSLKKFDGQGNFLKKTGGKGQEPGEFLAPRLVACTEKSVLVTDQYIPGIQVFDKELNYVRRVSISVSVADFKILPNKRIAVTTLDYGRGGRIQIYDDKGVNLKSVQYAGKEKSPLKNLVNFECDSEGNFYLAYNFRDRIEKIDTNGKSLWSRSILQIKAIKKKRIALWEVPTEIVYKDVALDSKGRIFILGGSFSKNTSRDVYVLDKEGNWVATLTLPEPSHCIYLDAQDHLYSRANEGLTLKKYRVKERKMLQRETRVVSSLGRSRLENRLYGGSGISGKLRRLSVMRENTPRKIPLKEVQ